MATAMASYGFERMQHMSDDDLEESASTRNMTSASYPSPTPASRKSRSGAAASKSQDMKMVEIKHGSYDPSAQRWPHQDGGEGHHRRTVTASTTAPRRDYLREGHSPGERDHLLTQPTSPGRHARPHHHAHFPSTSSSPSSSATSTTATVTFTMTTSSSATSVSYSSSSTYSYSTPSPPMASSPATLPSSSSGSLASSPPMLLVYPESPSSSTLKKSKKQHHHHHHHHHSKTKKRVTWVDESVEGTRLEEVIEVERYLTQHGSLSWWLELMWDNKPYFLLLLCIALLFLASLVFILYKLVF